MKARCIKLVLLWITIPIALGAAVMVLWNLLIPAIFGLTVINFWQALGLLVLTRILFGGFGRGWMHNRMHHHGMGENPIHEKWRKMTPEQRKEFVRERRKFGFGRPFGRDRFDIDAHEESRNGNE